MPVLVDSHQSDRLEARVALVALHTLLRQVYGHVLQVAAAAVEGGAAVRAAERLLARVEALVDLDLFSVRGAVVTIRTLVRLLVPVPRAAVHQQQPLRYELLAAVLTNDIKTRVYFIMIPQRQF